MLKQVFFAPFGACGDAVWPMESPKNALQVGRFGTQWAPKVGPQRRFSKLILDHLGHSKQVFLARLSPCSHGLAHGKSQNALQVGPL